MNEQRIAELEKKVERLEFMFFVFQHLTVNIMMNKDMNELDEGERQAIEAAEFECNILMQELINAGKISSSPKVKI